MPVLTVKIKCLPSECLLWQSLLMVTREYSAKQKIRMALISRGLTQRDLADAIGHSFTYTRMVVCGLKRCRPVREKIEQALGLAVWSDPEVLEKSAQHNSASAEPVGLKNDK